MDCCHVWTILVSRAIYKTTQNPFLTQSKTLLRYDSPLQLTARTGLQSGNIGAPRLSSDTLILDTANRNPNTSTQPYDLELTRYQTPAIWRWNPLRYPNPTCTPRKSYCIPRATRTNCASPPRRRSNIATKHRFSKTDADHPEHTHGRINAHHRPAYAKPYNYRSLNRIQNRQTYRHRQHIPATRNCDTKRRSEQVQHRTGSVQSHKDSPCNQPLKQIRKKAKRRPEGRLFKIRRSFDSLRDRDHLCKAVAIARELRSGCESNLSTS